MNVALVRIYTPLILISRIGTNVHENDGKPNLWKNYYIYINPI